MKIVRLGMTEAGLLFLTYAYKNIQLPPDIHHAIAKHITGLMNWLYTTSGYYDKSVQGTRFNFNSTGLTRNFGRYMEHLKESVANCAETQVYFHDGFIRQLFEAHRQSFISHFHITNFKVLNETRLSDRLPSIFSHIKEKRVLVITSFATLIQQQFDSGHVYQLGLSFPPILGLDTVLVPYCFCNHGPHANYFETLDFIFEQIREKEFDIALLGCGAYGHMLTHKIHADLHKDAIYIGGGITTLFGILSTREKKSTDLIPNEYWICDIPDEYKPENYKAVEDGCYW